MKQCLRYIRFGEPISQAERERVWETDLFKLGDTVLVWVNEGDLCALGANMAPAPIDEKDAEISRLKSIIRSMGGTT